MSTSDAVSGFDQAPRPVRHQVDPAALMVAVFAVGVGPLVQPGPWGFVNTLTAAVVLMVLLAFASPLGSSGTGRLNVVTRTAYSGVYAFTIAVGLCWPIQELRAPYVAQSACSDPHAAQSVLTYLKASDCMQANDDAVAAAGTTGGLLVGLAAFVLLLAALSRTRQPISDRSKSSSGRTRAAGTSVKRDDGLLPQPQEPVPPKDGGKQERDSPA